MSGLDYKTGVRSPGCTDIIRKLRLYRNALRQDRRVLTFSNITSALRISSVLKCSHKRLKIDLGMTYKILFKNWMQLWTKLCDFMGLQITCFPRLRAEHVQRLRWQRRGYGVGKKPGRLLPPNNDNGQRHIVRSAHLQRRVRLLETTCHNPRRTQYSLTFSSLN